MERKVIWYSVHNGGDGSAYPVFMETKEQVVIDQRNQDEGWGEPCYGNIIVESDSPITVVSHVLTVADQLKELEDELNEDYLQEYKKAGKYPGWWGRLEDHVAALKELMDGDSVK